MNSALVSILPWALKIIGLIFIYNTIIRYLTKRKLFNNVLVSKTYILVFLYCLVMFFSFIINSSEIVNLFKSTLIVFIYPIFVTVAILKPSQKESVKAGLFYSALLYTLYFSFFIDWTQFFNPEYRGDSDYDVFTALNGAFIFAYSIEKALFSVNKKYYKIVFYLIATYGFSLVFVVKSRGIMGILIILVIFNIYKKIYLKNKLGSKLVILFFIFSTIFIASIFIEFESIASKVIDVFHLTNEGSRSLADGSGRFMVWEYALKHLWPKEFWFGHGPRANFELIHNIFPIDGAHNFLIATAVDVGLIGLILILSLLILPLLNFNSKLSEVFGWPYYIIGLEGIMNENLLFSYGFPAAWVVLISIASLSVKNKHGIIKC
jgi:hypothetical protein